jgi:hypothetical protein
MPRTTSPKPVFTETVFALIILALAALGVLISALQPWIEPRWLYLDTTAVGEARGTCCSVFDGAVSNLGLMLWAGTAAVALFTVFIKLGAKQACRLEALSFATSAMLLIDDAFLVHEIILPTFGVPQTLVIGVIGALSLVYLFAARRRILRSPHRWLLYLGLALFAMSIGIDQVFYSTASWMVVLEDGPKFIGIVCWFLFHLSFFRDSLVNAQSAEA